MQTLAPVVWLLACLASCLIEVRLGTTLRHADADSASKRTDHMMQFATLLALIVDLMALLGAWMPTVSELLVGAGVALSTIGMGLRAHAMRRLGRSFTLTPTSQHGGALLTSGAYAIVRHPGYSALLLLFMGLAALTGQPLALLGVLPMALAVPLRIRHEERLLRMRFGSEYIDYAGRVRFVLAPGVF